MNGIPEAKMSGVVQNANLTTGIVYQKRAESKERRKRICKICGNVFYPRWTQIRLGQGIVCSIKCRNAIQSGSGNPMHGRSITEEQKEKRRITLRLNGKMRGRNHPFFKEKIKGYRNFIDVDGKRKVEHREVAAKILGRPLTSSEIVHHRDKNKSNNDPKNIEIMTRAEHLKEHFFTDILPKRKEVPCMGEHNGSSKLNNIAVDIIRSSDMSLTELAKIFNVTTSCISDVRKYKTWKHI